MQRFVPVMESMSGDIWSPGAIFSCELPQFTVSSSIVNLVYRNLYAEDAIVAIMGDYSALHSVRQRLDGTVDRNTYSEFCEASQSIQSDGAAYQISSDFMVSLISKKRSGFLYNYSKKEFVDLSRFTRLDEIDPLVLLTTGSLLDVVPMQVNGTWAFSRISFRNIRPEGREVFPIGDMNSIIEHSRIPVTSAVG